MEGREGKGKGKKRGGERADGEGKGRKEEGKGRDPLKKT